MIAAQLSARVPHWVAGARGVDKVRQLSGGASQETWSFDILRDVGVQGAILRRAPPGPTAAPQRSAGLSTEAALMRLAYEAGVPSPRVFHELVAADDLGTGFVMDRVDGETIPRKILRDAQFDAIRPTLAHRLGGVLAVLHRLPDAELPPLRLVTAAAELDDLRREIDAFGRPRPVFEMALRWLRQNDPGEPPRTTLVHGDFRHGNLMIGPDGLRAVLDWELAHRGDPMEDLGWICVTSWRFGGIDKPVGGFGLREDLFAGYEAAGGRVDPARVRYWETMGTLRWGVMCCGMMKRFRDNPEYSMEQGIIGRRSSETEIDLLRILMPRGSD